MAWVKIPAEHHALFLAAVPKHPKVTTLKMFGGIAAKANGQMFAGLFAKSFIVKLSDKDRDEAMALDGAEPFDPMGNGRTMSNTILMPEETFGDDAELKAWLSRALDYTLTLPAKAATSKDKPVAVTTSKPAGKGPAPKATSAKPSSTKASPAKPTTTKAPAKAKPAAKKR
jgi:TfoX/Sxy family transcriptional regulator of competence genes